MEQKIPKIIHYCWFGNNPKPQLVQKCIESWKKNCPDYEIIEWNEDNFDIHCHPFVEDAYREKKWAFVSDFVRASALLEKGGVYLDTDLELIKPLDPLLGYGFFVGFESNDTLGSAVFGCGEGNDVLRRYFNCYDGMEYSNDFGPSMTTSPIVLTRILSEKGLKLNGRQQQFSDCMVFSKSVFYPTGLRWVFGRYGSKTVGVHHYMDSWGKNNSLGERTRRSKLRLCLLYHMRDLLGTDRMYELGKKMRNRRQGK